MHWDQQKIVHPLFAYTGAFALGILAKSFELNIVLMVMVIFLLIILAFFLKKLEPSPKFKFQLCVIFFLLGFLRFYLWETHNNYLIERLKQKSDYTAVVIDMSDHTHPFFKHKITLKLRSSAERKTYTLNIHVPTNYDIRISDRLKVYDLKINSPKNRQKSLYSNESTTPKLFTSKLLFLPIYRPKFSLLRIIKEAKYNLAKSLSTKMSKATSTLFEYIFLGLKNANDYSDQLRSKFNYWGIAHYLARSGLHMVMLLFLWALFLKLFPLNFILKQALLTVLSILYFLLSWPSTSFERALVTFLLVQICIIFKWPVRSSYLITLCSLLFLIVNPCQLFFLDFQLSFGLTLGISIFNEIYNKKR